MFRWQADWIWDANEERNLGGRGVGKFGGEGALELACCASRSSVSFEMYESTRPVCSSSSEMRSCKRSTSALSVSPTSPLPFHWMLFLLFFSISPIPSRTFVMSYILLKHCQKSGICAPSSGVNQVRASAHRGALHFARMYRRKPMGYAWHRGGNILPALLDTEVLSSRVEVQDAILRLLDEPHEFLGEES